MIGARSRHTFFLLVLGTFLSAGCGDGDGGDGDGNGNTPPPPPPPPPPVNTTLSYQLTDGCLDGEGLYVRYFDVDHALVWPDATNAYVIAPGGTATHTLSCRKDAKICFGAESPSRSLYWGVGIDLAYSCTNCCSPCQGQRVAWTLTCANARRDVGVPRLGELRPDRDEPRREGLPTADRMRPEGEPRHDQLPVADR